MATSAQIAANRANAQLSTGPTSGQGKEKSSRNRLVHGFRSTCVLLPGDDPREYDDLHRQFRIEFQPIGLTEQRCIREMVDAEWRLRRVRAYQQSILVAYIEELAAKHPDKDAMSIQALAFDAAISNSSLKSCIRYENQYQRQYDRAYKELTSSRERASRQQLRAPRPAVVPLVPFEPNCQVAGAPSCHPFPLPVPLGEGAPEPTAGRGR